MSDTAVAEVSGDATRERRAPVVRNPVLARGTLLTPDMDRLAGFCAEGLGLEAVRLGPDRMALTDRFTGKDGKAYWMLDARYTPKIDVPQTTLNHWGVTVQTREEVDEAYARITALKEKYGVRHVQKPREQHQSYSFYIADADSNWWEVEYREPDVTYEQLTDMHWLKAVEK